LFQRILVAWDGSELAGRALDAAVQFAARYEAQVVAASVVRAPPHQHQGPAEMTEQAHRRLAAAFEEGRGPAERSGVAISHEILDGHDAAADLLAYAHEHGFDLVVIGHHRHPRPGTFVLHGVTEHLVSAADVPVLVVGG
jgi:nucleotide-binding universal stress UspA family protein